MVVYTAAVKEDNPETGSQKNNIPIMDRLHCWGRSWNISLFHWHFGNPRETTTTSMLSVIMNHAKFDPTVLVGGEVDAIGGNVRTATAHTS